MLPAAVKHENFKTCAQSGFCTRNRALADSITAQSATYTSPYRLDPSTLHFEAKTTKLTAVVLKTTASGATVRLPLTVSVFESGTSRVTLDEELRQKGEIELRHGSKARKERYNDLDQWALVGGTEPSTTAKLVSTDDPGVTRLEWGDGRKNAAIVRHAPFGVEFQRDGETHVVFNRRGFMNVEHWRPKKEAVEGQKAAPGEDESTWWEESFGGNTDSKPRGPESVGLDITFPGYAHVFGIPEHTGPLSLRETRYVTSLTPNGGTR